jgi:hypothetical protein
VVPVALIPRVSPQSATLASCSVPLSTPACLQGSLADRRGSCPRLKIVVCPVRVRVSPRPVSPADRGVLLVRAPTSMSAHAPLRMAGAIPMHDVCMSRSSDRLRSPDGGLDRRGPRPQETPMPKYLLLKRRRGRLHELHGDLPAVTAHAEAARRGHQRRRARRPGPPGRSRSGRPSGRKVVSLSVVGPDSGTSGPPPVAPPTPKRGRS